MEFSMDKRKVQQAGLSLLPPPQWGMGDDCPGTALQTQPWRMWLRAAAQEPP